MGNVSGMGTRLCVPQAGKQARNVAISHVKVGENFSSVCSFRQEGED